MKTLLFFVFIFFGINMAKGQTDSTNEYFDAANLKPDKSSPKSQWGVNVGAFGGSYNGQGYYGSFLSPNYKLNLSSKFSVQAGVIFSSFSMPSRYNSEGGSIINNSYNTSIFYTQGVYKVNKKIFITGGAYTSLNNKPGTSNNLNPAYYNDDIKGGKIGIGYNINDHSSLYLEMQINKGYSPFNSCSSSFSNGFGNSFVGW